MKTSSKLIAIIAIMFISGAVLAQSSWNYISPKPGSKYINPENTIAFRHGEVLDITSIRSDRITVSSTSRGEISGNFILSKDQRTLIFYPDQAFDLKEKIQVCMDGGIRTISGIVLDAVDFHFEVKPHDNQLMLSKFYQNEYEKDIAGIFKQKNNGDNVTNALIGNRESANYPEGFPVPTIFEYDNPAPGYIFCTPRPFQIPDYDPYTVILDNYGIPVFYRQWPRRTNDFKTIVNNRLTLCDFNNQNTSVNKYLVMNSKFDFTDTLLMGNGYIIDQHDVIVLENGNHFLMAYDPQLVNMDTVYPGGDTAATVIGFVIQELDADHNVVFQWRSWDHFDILDANHTDFTAGRVDYVHGNAFEIDNDGNLMMSNRNMEEITKIDLVTGEIIWRLGLHAKNNMFTFTNDTVGFSWQHDIRRLDNGNITVYDNGNYHTPKFSQALEYQIDEDNYTAELVWNYIHDPVVYGRATGAHRELANGNKFICWGLTWTINYSEVTPDKSLAWELHWPENIWDYRAFKFDWSSDFLTTNVDNIDYGEYTGYVPWPRIFTITNNSDRDIQITSTHNHWDSYYVSTDLPLDIAAGATVEMTVNLSPTMQGQIDDVLTLNYDSFYSDTLHQRISTQISLTGYVPDDLAPEVTLEPADGSKLVPQDAIVTITFNEPVVKTNGDALKTSDLDGLITFRLDGDSTNAVPYNASIDVWKTKITILPDTLYPDQNYFLKVAGNMLSDKAGNIITDATESRFTTGEEFGIQEDIIDNIALYPNPTSGKFHVELTKYKPEYINVVDISGRSIFTLDQPDDSRIEIDLTDQASGIYFIEFKFESITEPVSMKVIKQ